MRKTESPDQNESRYSDTQNTSVKQQTTANCCEHASYDIFGHILQKARGEGN